MTDDSANLYNAEDCYKYLKDEQLLGAVFKYGVPDISKLQYQFL